MDANKVLQRIEPITAILTNCPIEYKVSICIVKVVNEEETL